MYLQISQKDFGKALKRSSKLFQNVDTPQEAGEYLFSFVKLAYIISWSRQISRNVCSGFSVLRKVYPLSGHFLVQPFYDQVPNKDSVLLKFNYYSGIPLFVHSRFIS